MNYILNNNDLIIPTMSIPTLEPKFLFGLTTLVNGNCLFLNENEIIYPAAGVLIIYDISRHKQKYIRLAEPQKVITAMALCINKYVLQESMIYIN